MAKKAKKVWSPEIIQIAEVLHDKLLEEGEIKEHLDLQRAVSEFIRGIHKKKILIHLCANDPGFEARQERTQTLGGRRYHRPYSYYFPTACNHSITTKKSVVSWKDRKKVTCPRCKKTSLFKEHAPNWRKFGKALDDELKARITEEQRLAPIRGTLEVMTGQLDRLTPVQRAQVLEQLQGGDG